MKNSLIYILVLLSVLFTSCKEYLDLKPYGKTLPKTSEEFSALLHNYLNDLDYGNDRDVFGNASSLSDYECFTDNMETSLINFNNVYGLPLYIGSRINVWSSYYGKLYSQIKDCNIIIDRITEGDKGTREGKDVLGTAHALRAVCYYNLIRHFAEPFDKSTEDDQLGVPLVKYFDMEAKPNRSKLIDCLDFVIEDLEKAIKYNVTKDVYRFTKDVAKFYLARTYFWKEDWANAAAVSKELLEKYPLLEGEEYKNMLQEKNNKKGNVILRSYTIPGSQDLGTSHANESISKDCPVSKRFVDLFAEGSDDIRFNFYFEKRHNTKYLSAKLRSAEMCLTLAESYAHMSSKQQESLIYLNLLRSNRINNYTPYTISSLPDVNPEYLIKEDAEGKALTPLLYAIITERQKELYMEGDRWFEMKRNGRPEFWVVNNLKFVTEKYLYTAPFPKDDAMLVEGFVQNIGYK